MSTPNGFTVYKAVVHSVDDVTNVCLVHIPAIASNGVVPVSPTGLPLLKGAPVLPTPGDIRMVAVDSSGSTFHWVVSAEATTTWTTLSDIDDLLTTITQRMIPAGTVSATVGATADVGYLLLNGSSVLNANTNYPSLWERVPTAWKSGTTLNLVDARGRTIIGAGTGAGLTARTLAALLGEETHLNTADESGLPAHNHTQNAHTHVQNAHSHTNILGGNSGAIVTSQVVANLDTYGTTQQGGSTTATNQDTTATNNANTAASAVSAHNNMQPSLVLNWQIKAH